MKQLLTNPIMVNLEIGLIEDLIKIIVNAIHPHVSHGEVNAVLSNITKAREKALSKDNAEDQK